MSETTFGNTDADTWETVKDIPIGCDTIIRLAHGNAGGTLIERDFEKFTVTLKRADGSTRTLDFSPAPVLKQGKAVETP